VSEFIETIIVGGGQAGLAISYYLKQEGREHLVLERAPAIANAWRNQRWDSFNTGDSELPGADARSRIQRKRLTKVRSTESSGAL
jgi:glycine/D-amino acid oxidase-like deaminating enzyme